MCKLQYFDILLLLSCWILQLNAQYGGYYWSYCRDSSGNSLNGNYAYFTYCSTSAYNNLVSTYGNPSCVAVLSSTCQYGGFRVTDSCEIGYYTFDYLYNLNPTANCAKCDGTLSYNSVKPDHSTFKSNGNFNNACTMWQCDAGFYKASQPSYVVLTLYHYPYGTASVYYDYSCLKCTSNQYSNTDNLACSQCPQITATVKAMCSVGQYYILSPVDCSFVSCSYCSTKPSNTYFSTVSGASADYTRYDSCYYSACQPCTEIGKYRVNCGTTGNLASAGSCVICTNIATFSSYETPTDLRYYIAGYDSNGLCLTAACAPCNAGYYNSGCPVSGGGTISQTCTLCSASTILNSQYAVATGYVPSASACPIICSPGFYKVLSYSSFTCQPCIASNVCLSGYYTDVCNYDGSGGSAAKCVACPNTNLPSAASAAWTISKAEFGPTACSWQCLKGYYRIGSGCSACTYTNLTCAAGFYIKAPCIIVANSSDAPSCSPCSPTSNSFFTSPGSVVNDPSSCLFSCSAGFWLSGSICIAWSTPTCSASLTLGGGTNLADQTCISCPSASMPSNLASWELSSKYEFAPVGQCTWTCQAGYYYIDNQCKSCESGKYKNASGNSGCTLCPSGKFQNGGEKPQLCDLIPANSMDMANRTFFICFQNSRPEFGPLTQLWSCISCAFLSPNTKNVSFFNNTCFVSSFLCSAGYYRQIATSNIPNNAQCLTCPNISQSIALWPSSQTIDVLIQQSCKPFPSCMDPKDEVNLACPISCQAGAYLNASKNSLNSTTYTLTCTPCTTVTCPLGKISSLCKTGTTNICTSCSQILTQGQVWNNNSCVWQCTYGYSLYGSICQQCSQGTYKSTISNTTNCTACARGYYSNLPAASSCSMCTPGTYTPVSGSIICSNCNPGSFASGYNSSVCTLCPANSYSSLASSQQCTPCTSSLPYATVGGVQCGLPPPPCPPGFYLEIDSSTACVGCVPGVYCLGGLDNSSQNQMPLPCAWNISKLYTAPLSSSQANCTPSSNCIRSNTIAVACPSNTGTRGYPGAKSAVWCHPNAGYYGLPGTAAQPCPQDFYCVVGLTTIRPIPCPPSAKYSQAMSVSSSNCSAVMYPPCRPGYYLMPIAGGCYPCPESSFCSGPAPITACSPNSTWYSPALSKSITDCILKTIAGVGIIMCPANTAVPPNTYGSDIYIASTLQCRAMAGFYFIAGYHTQGIPCPSGFFCPAATQNPIACTPKICNVNGNMQTPNICPQQSSAQLPECIPCTGLIANAHYTSVNSCSFCCDAGYVLTQLSPTTQACIVIANTTTCQEGQYMPVPDSTGCTVSISTCAMCPIPTISGSATLPLNIRLSLLKSGQLPIFGDGACILGCLPGYYNGNVSVDLCKPCPAGKFRGSDISTNSTSISCLSCDSGKYASKEASTQCMTCGKWTVPASNDYCSICDVWSSSPPLFCKLCREWSTITRTNCTCISGTYMSLNLDGSLECLECPLGSISILGSPSSCFTCPAGQFCTDLTPRQVCPPGSTRATPTSTCIPCLKGSMSNYSESSSCTLCAPGSYSTFLNATSCTKCPLNTYLPTSGGFDSSQCQPCENWVYGSVSQAGSGQCGCPPNTYYDGISCHACSTCNANATTTTPCAYGSTADTVTCTCKAGFAGDGITSCQKCLNPAECVCPKTYHYDFVDI